MPAEAVVLRERETGRGGQREAGAQLPVERVAVGEEQRERVGATVEEDGDEHLLRPGGGSGGDPLVERPRKQRRAAVDRECEPGGAREEGAPVEPRAGRERHPALDRRQAAAGLGGGAAEEVGAREV